MEELIVRINALLNRNKNENLNEPIKLGNYSFNLKKQTLQINSEIETLTHREAHLLYHLINNQNEVLERSFILKKLWGDDDFFNARSMDVFITKLRKKLNKDDTLQIVNVRGYGYKLIC
jgi:DNA-binding response OmpR family regulator